MWAGVNVQWCEETGILEVQESINSQEAVMAKGGKYLESVSIIGLRTEGQNGGMQYKEGLKSEIL